MTLCCQLRHDYFNTLALSIAVTERRERGGDGCDVIFGL
jgi:hypothetical protein